MLVVIKKEYGEYVARTSDKSWLSRRIVDKNRRDMDLARYLFPDVDIIEVESFDEMTIVVIDYL